MSEKKAKRIGSIIEAATKSGLVDGEMRGNEIIKFGLEQGIAAGYVFAWESYVAVIAAPDDDDDDDDSGDSEPASW